MVCFDCMMRIDIRGASKGWFFLFQDEVRRRCVVNLAISSGSNGRQ